LNDDSPKTRDAPAAAEDPAADQDAGSAPDPEAEEAPGGRRRGARGRKAGPGRAATPPPPVVVRPLAPMARTQRRHWGLLLTFLLMVLGPSGTTGWYLYTRAADQYASTLGFTVRREDFSSASDLIGGLTSSLGSSGSHDSDILYEYIGSQELVAAVDARLGLAAIYSRHLDTDPLLSFDPSGTIEDMTRYWNRMMRVSYDGGSGLMELRILAFDPVEAKAIAEAVFDECSKMINALSAAARTDATRYAAQDLEASVERLKQAREALTQFRLANQIVDLTADIQGQMGLLNNLQGQLAAALIDLDLLVGTARDGDPRLIQAQRRIEVIRARIEDERRKFGAGGVGPGGENYATTVSNYERLTVDREYAERAYTAALSAYDAARAEADRQSLYLAAYIRPTRAEQAEFPQREIWTGLVALFGFLIWSILALIYYSLRDRR
jgi:capsular polysaccharide transport system permease protein